MKKKILLLLLGLFTIIEIYLITKNTIEQNQEYYDVYYIDFNIHLYGAATRENMLNSLHMRIKDKRLDNLFTNIKTKKKKDESNNYRVLIKKEEKEVFISQDYEVEYNNGEVIIDRKKVEDIVNLIDDRYGIECAKSLFMRGKIDSCHIDGIIIGIVAMAFISGNIKEMVFDDEK